MPDLLLELFCEEIPARMQAGAAEDLKRLVTGALVDRGIVYEAAVSFVTPRRLALHIVGLPARQPDVAEERKGPRVGAPEAALAGFLKSAGLASIDQAAIETDPKKGSFYVARLRRAGRETSAVLAEIIPVVVKGFPWPKTMRWGAASAQPESLRWVRPLQSIVCLFGPETEEPEVVPFEIGGVVSGNVTHGHRFMAPAAIRVRRFDDYVAALEKAKVVLDAARRRDIILADAKNLAFAAGLELVEDEGLLAEVAGLVEWPVVLMGGFDADFLAIPPEVIRATIRANQKCFVLRDGSGKLSNRFILVANIEASDGGKAIAAGNARVVRARLSDAKFFWESDLKVKLEDRLPKLDSIVFHEKLGTQGERVKRIMALAREIAPLVGADPVAAERAAQLAKADLTSEMVGEFPELQGLMGRYYAAAQGESAAVAAAVEDHYRPQGPADRIPTEPLSVAVALADKLDTLDGFWAIDEKPTGSKDPFALRRAALGVVRLVLENGLHIQLASLVGHTGQVLANMSGSKSVREFSTLAHNDLLTFLADRLKVYLRDKGARHDIVDAVFSLPLRDDLCNIRSRVIALAAFLDSDDGKNLLAGFKRAANILRAEEKKDGAGAFDAPHVSALLTLPAETALALAIAGARSTVTAALEREDFAAAMRALAQLRAPVDAFFDQVTVNDPAPKTRLNRLRLLNELRGAMAQVADFGKVSG